jgi:hypothetical protein
MTSRERCSWLWGTSSAPADACEHSSTRANTWHPPTPSLVSKSPVLFKFLQTLLAIILGNVVYFVLIPSLPPSARHHPFRLDLGLVLDFWFCLVAYGLIRTTKRWR